VGKEIAIWDKVESKKTGYIEVEEVDDLLRE
jgi:hypothetical protein